LKNLVPTWKTIMPPKPQCDPPRERSLFQEALEARAIKTRALYRAGHATTEIARILHSTPGAVWSLLTRTSHLRTPDPLGPITMRRQGIWKLTQAKVAEIRAQRLRGRSYGAIAKTCRVAKTHVWNICRGNAWKAPELPARTTTID
jgi:hypothetical protein